MYNIDQARAYYDSRIRDGVTPFPKGSLYSSKPSVGVPYQNFPKQFGPTAPLKNYKLNAENITVKSASDVKLGKVSSGAMQNASRGSSNAALQTAGSMLGVMGAAAGLGPLAIAAFGVMAVSRMQEAKKERERIKKAMKQEADMQRTRNAIFANRNGLENIAVRNTFLDIGRRAMKNRSAFNVAKGESISGTSYNLLQQALRRNELETKQRILDKNVQKRIAMREHLVLQYAATKARMDQLAAGAPTNADVAMGIIGDGIKVATQYAAAGGFESGPTKTKLPEPKPTYSLSGELPMSPNPDWEGSKWQFWQSPDKF